MSSSANRGPRKLGQRRGSWKNLNKPMMDFDMNSQSVPLHGTSLYDDLNGEDDADGEDDDSPLRLGAQRSTVAKALARGREHMQSHAKEYRHPDDRGMQTRGHTLRASPTASSQGKHSPSRPQNHARTRSEGFLGVPDSSSGAYDPGVPLEHVYIDVNGDVTDLKKEKKKKKKKTSHSHSQSHSHSHSHHRHHSHGHQLGHGTHREKDKAKSPKDEKEKQKRKSKRSHDRASSDQVPTQTQTASLSPTLSGDGDAEFGNGGGGGNNGTAGHTTITHEHRHRHQEDAAAGTDGETGAYHRRWRYSADDAVEVDEGQDVRDVGGGDDLRKGKGRTVSPPRPLESM